MQLSKKLAALTLTGAVIGGTLTACGDSDSGVPVSYAPVAYGIPGQCYYVNSPAEAVTLQAAGLCPRSWVPVLMPLAWHMMYASYYDGPGYYNRYVPVGQRNVYINKTTVFEKNYSSGISKASKNATYKGSDGSTIKNPSKTTVQNGGGGGRNSGGGTRNCGASYPQVQIFSRGGGSGGGGGGHGSSGGSGRSGGGGSGRSGGNSGKTSGGSKGGC